MSSEKDSVRQSKLKSKISYVTAVVGNVTRITGLLLTVISMHILVIRPLVDRVDQLQTQLHEIDATLSRVAAEHSNLSSTNDLLSELKTQHDEIAGARATLQQLHKLREEIEFESNKIPDAMEAVTRLSELPNHLHQSELDRYTTLTKPVPNPYQELSTIDATPKNNAVEVPQTVKPVKVHTPIVTEVAVPPLLFISGNTDREAERISIRESNRMFQ